MGIARKVSALIFDLLAAIVVPSTFWLLATH